MMLAGKKTGRRPLFFWLALAIVLAAIAATVLLARDMENLRRLADWLGMPMAPRTMVIPKPGTTGHVSIVRPAPIRDKVVDLPPWVLAPEIPGYDSGMMRTVFKSGPVICDSLKAAGIAVTPWQKAQLGKGMECYAEAITANPDKPDDPSSFFLMIKGTESGAFVSARLKIIFSSLEGRAEMVGRAVTAIDALARATGWTELAEMEGKISRFEPFAFDSFGINVKFYAEFGGPGRYNLIITMVPKTPPTKRTAAYFDRETRFDLPPDLVTPRPVP